MANKTIQPVSVPNLKSFGPMKTDSWAKEVGEVSIMLYGKIGSQALFCLVAAILMYGDFLNLNSLNSCIYWSIGLKLAETIQNHATYIV